MLTMCLIPTRIWLTYFVDAACFWSLNVTIYSQLLEITYWHHMASLRLSELTSDNREFCTGTLKAFRKYMYLSISIVECETMVTPDTCPGVTIVNHSTIYFYEHPNILTLRIWTSFIISWMLRSSLLFSFWTWASWEERKFIMTSPEFYNIQRLHHYSFVIHHGNTLIQLCTSPWQPYNIASQFTVPASHSFATYN